MLLIGSTLVLCLDRQSRASQGPTVPGTFAVVTTTRWLAGTVTLVLERVDGLVFLRGPRLEPGSVGRVRGSAQQPC